MIGVWKEGLEHGWYEGVTIYIAVVIIVSVTAGNDYMKEKQFQKLMEVRKSREILAIRGNKPIPVNTYDLVVGDILELHAGDQLPADAVVIEADHMQVDESNITGESKHLRKETLKEDMSNAATANPFLLEGSMVVLGEGKAVVCAVGESTQNANVEEKLFEDDDEATPLQKKLDNVAEQIGKIGVYCAVATFLALTVNTVLNCIMTNQPLLSVPAAKQIVNAIVLGITIVVVAVPEGLPLAVTISLAYSVNQMKNENNLVRRLEAAETMGGAD